MDEDQVKGLKLISSSSQKKGTRRLNEYLSGRSWKVCETEVKRFGFGPPWWSSGKNPSANAGNTSLTPGLGRSYIPQDNEGHAPQLRSRWASRACAPQQEKPPQQEAVLATDEQILLSATRESVCAATETQCSQK